MEQKSRFQWQQPNSNLLFCGVRDQPGVFLCAVSFFTVLPCGMAIKQHCTGLSLHTELQRRQDAVHQP